MEITPPFTNTRCGIIAAISALFICSTLRAAEASESYIFPACKSKVGAIDINTINTPNLDPCMFRCPPTVKTVCSNDGMSHMNECFLCKAACHNPHRPLFKVCDGRCPCKGKPHEDEPKEDCVDGNCDQDAKDHYAEDFGFDIEDPAAKYKIPDETDPNVLHESKGFETTPADAPIQGGSNPAQEEIPKPEVEAKDSDCLDGQCDQHAKEHDAEDLGSDDEETESPGQSTAYILHESKGYETTPADLPEQTDDELPEVDGELEADAGEEWDDDAGAWESNEEFDDDDDDDDMLGP